MSELLLLFLFSFKLHHKTPNRNLEPETDSKYSDLKVVIEWNTLNENLNINIVLKCII